MNSTVRVCSAALAGVLMSSAAVANAPDIGKAEVVVPDAKRTSVEQDERNLQVGTDVFKDDVVKTGNIGAVMLLFNDKTTLKIFPNSKVKLDNYVYDADKTVLHVGLNLLSGAMRIASGGPHTADKYQLRTPQATIGIRGTVIHIVTDGERTVVEALHGTFHACATTGSACRTVSATDDMNALRLWNDGRIEAARARRDLGVRSAQGSSDAATTQPTQLSSAVGSNDSLDGIVRSGNDASSPLPANVVQSLPLNAPAALPSAAGPSTTAVPSGTPGTVAPFMASGRSSGDPVATSSADGGTSQRDSGGADVSIGNVVDLLFGPSAASETGGHYSGGTSSGGAPAPEVNAFVGLALVGGTVVFIRRKRNLSTADLSKQRDRSQATAQNAYGS